MPVIRELSFAVIAQPLLYDREMARPMHADADLVCLPALCDNGHANIFGLPNHPQDKVIPQQGCPPTVLRAGQKNLGHLVAMGEIHDDLSRIIAF